jgi:hypothetical protein
MYPGRVSGRRQKKAVFTAVFADCNDNFKSGGLVDPLDAPAQQDGLKLTGYAVKHQAVKGQALVLLLILYSDRPMGPLNVQRST